MSFDTSTPFLSRSASEHNYVYYTYVCLVNHGIHTMSDIDVNERTSDRDAGEQSDGERPELIQVERSKAVHELLKSTIKKDQSLQKKPKSGTSEESKVSDLDDLHKYDNPKVLKLTKMKWLSEDQTGYPDSSTPSVSSLRSTTSSKAEDSDVEEINHQIVGDKCLSTILRLDKEHNLFGMSSIAIIGSKQSRPMKQTRKDEKPVFHQTAIVQFCCAKSCNDGCCRNRSATDLPSSLKYPGCASCLSCCLPPRPPPCPQPCPRPPSPCCFSTYTSCTPVGPPTCAIIPRNPKIHVTCLPDTPRARKPMAICSKPCGGSPPCTLPASEPCAPPPPSKCPESLPPCMQQCTCGLTAFLPPEPDDCCYGLRLKLNRKPKYDPPVIEITPRCSSVLTKPEMARCCNHNPRCQPPAATFPYLMPCYWPCRPSAPCSEPENCFHHPPCLPPRRERGPIPHEQRCPKPSPCADCKNKSCLGLLHPKLPNPQPKKKLKEKHKIECECDQPLCVRCFVTKPNVK